MLGMYADQSRRALKANGGLQTEPSQGGDNDYYQWGEMEGTEPFYIAASEYKGIEGQSYDVSPQVEQVHLLAQNQILHPQIQDQN